MSHVYTGRMRMRHYELDAFGRATPAACLRQLAQIAIDASAAVGYDGAWYAGAGAQWMVRRSTMELLRPLRADDALQVRTWVEDFRRVRSRRRYEVRDRDEAVVLAAVTDWVYVDMTTGRVRRVPAEMEERFGSTPGNPGPARPAWESPPPPAAPARVPCPVRWSDIDALGHVNNAAYLELLVQATFDVLGGAGWSIDRLVADGGVPTVAMVDIEYLEAARYGERVDAVTWFGGDDRALDVHQQLVRADDGRALVRVNATWRWRREGGDDVAVPAALLAALRPQRAA